MRAEAGIEHRFVFEYDDGGLDRVERASSDRQNRPSCRQGSLASGLARFYGIIGNVPRAAMNDEGGLHRLRECQCRGSLSTKRAKQRSQVVPKQDQVPSGTPPNYNGFAEYSSACEPSDEG